MTMNRSILATLLAAGLCVQGPTPAVAQVQLKINPMGESGTPPDAQQGADKCSDGPDAGGAALKWNSPPNKTKSQVVKKGTSYQSYNDVATAPEARGSLKCRAAGPGSTPTHTTRGTRSTKP